MTRRRKEKWCFGTSLLLALILLITGWVGEVQSEVKYPTRPIDIIVPWSPGASADLTTRVTAEFLKKKWGVPVNVINKPGGNTIPGCLEVYKAAPDGYTLLGDSPNSTSTLGVVFKDLPFKIMDRTLIAMTSNIPMILILPPDSQFRSIKDVEAEAKKDPENFTWTSLGGTGSQDIVARQFFKAIGVDVSRTKPVMCPGGAQAVSLTAGSHVKVGVGSVSGALSAIRGKMVRPLAITSSMRFSDLLPDLPTTAELGYPSVSCIYWMGVSGPPKMPSYIVDIWSEVLQEIVKDPKFNEKMKNIGAMVRYLRPHELKEFISKESDEYSKLFSK